MLQRYDYRDPFVPDGYSHQGIHIFDRTKGQDKTIAICTDVDQAQRIVDLLNADEKAKK